jgi:hypothetical protein
MAEPGVVRRVVVPIVLLGLTALGFLNTYGDASDVQKLAAQTACGGDMCPSQMVELSRSPFSQDYVFLVEKTRTRVQVKCVRAFIFLGDYACKKE